MSSRCLSAIVVLTAVPLLASERQLRVCADPNNLPFSNQAGQGFENHLAKLLADDLKAELKYTWWAERKAFIENSLQAGLCDIVMGVPSTLDSVLTTKPYYFSSYVFVERNDRSLNISSLNDERLAGLRIGIHVVGDDYAPPSYLLARHGLSSQIVGYSLYGKDGESNPPSVLVDAVNRGDVDIAIVWGPFAGYFGKSRAVRITPVTPPAFLSIPFTYGISAAVRQSEKELKTEIDQVFTRECKQIDALLTEYAVPRVQEDTTRCESSRPAAASLH